MSGENCLEIISKFTIPKTDYLNKFLINHKLELESENINKQKSELESENNLNKKINQNSLIEYYLKHKREMIYCDIIDYNNNEIIDTGLVTFFKSPNSYTGEDTVEFFLHGNPLLLRKFISVLLDSKLVRLARPGEFTKRSYLNKKINLNQAQAINQLIQARSFWEIKASQKNLRGEGGLLEICNNIRNELINIKAMLEADIDFSLKEIESDKFENFKRIEQFQNIKHLINKFLCNSKLSDKIRNSIQVMIYGAPNVGKSSLFNCLLGWERNIVSNIAGTTRDFISEEIILGDLTIRLIDTAGLRTEDENIDILEKEGINKTINLFNKSDLIIHLVSADTNFTNFTNTHKVPVINVINKIDLANSENLIKNSILDEVILISCVTNFGIEELKNKILATIIKNLDLENAILIEEYQSHTLREVNSILEKIIILEKENAPDEIISLELDESIKKIGELTTPVDSEEILGKIFSTFCVGK